MTSIRKKLLFLICGLFIISTIITSIVIFLSSQEEAREIFDANMMQIAQAVAHENGNKDFVNPEKIMADEEEFLVQIWNSSKNIEYTSHPNLALPLQNNTGYGTVDYQGNPWRYYTYQSGNQLIQVAQPSWLRNEVIVEIGLRFIIPILLQFPIIILFIWISVGKGLEPLNAVSHAIQKRQASNLEAIPITKTPIEVQTLMEELNKLLARLDHAIQSQKRFTADAAHELRTPLTAIQLYSDILNRSPQKKQHDQAINGLYKSIDRATHLVNQMLTLARQETNQSEQSFTPVDLSQIIKQSVETHQAIAADKKINLTLSPFEKELTLNGDAHSLRVLIDNILDNALLYTPKKGDVIVTLNKQTDSHICLTITDNGIGIPQNERDHVTERFYRILGTNVKGSGLGLSIVKQIADQHQATLSIDDGIDGKGTCFTFIFPA